jgi:DNA-binding MarR family transcriptional regulator
VEPVPRASTATLQPFVARAAYVRECSNRTTLLHVTPPTASRAPADEFVAWAEFRYQIRLWMRISEEAALEAGLPPQHQQVLLALKGFPGDEPPRIADLAERMQLRHHSMVGLLDRMEKQALIERVPLGGGRGVSIVMTREGERALMAVSRVLRPKLRVAGRDLIEALAPLVGPPPRGRASAAPARPRAARPRTRAAASATSRTTRTRRTTQG